MQRYYPRPIIQDHVLVTCDGTTPGFSVSPSCSGVSQTLRQNTVWN